MWLPAALVYTRNLPNDYVKGAVFEDAAPCAFMGDAAKSRYTPTAWILLAVSASQPSSAASTQDAPPTPYPSPPVG